MQLIVKLKKLRDRKRRQFEAHKKLQNCKSEETLSNETATTELSSFIIG